MDYSFKSSKIFSYLLVSLIFSFITVLDLLHLGYLKSHIVIVCEVIFVLLLWYVTGQLLYLMLFKKPALTITKDYIYDRINNIKYNWTDIDAFIESDTLLRIKLLDPKKYLNRSGDPVQKCIILFTFWLYSKKSPYVINLSMLDTNNKDLLQRMDDYRVKML